MFHHFLTFGALFSDVCYVFFSDDCSCMHKSFPSLQCGERSTLTMGDENVEQTNEDATLCKRSAVRFGYWNDPYIEIFCPRMTERKAPEIHLGYYTRVTGIKRLLDKALEVLDRCGEGVQVVNLGAGFDTLYWRLKDDLAERGKTRLLKNFIEMDLPGVTSKKCLVVKRSKTLLRRVAGGDNGDVHLNRTDLHGCDYHVVAADFTRRQLLEKKLDECGIDYSFPTVFVAECVLVYVSPAKTEDFLTWCCDKFSGPLVFLDHEQVNMRDRFGQVMLENLSHRGCSLAGVESCRDKDAQIRRFLSNGWSDARCWTMNEAYELLPRVDVERVEQLEFLDERELMRQLFEHYCLTVTWRNQGNVSFDGVEDWLSY